MGIDIQNLCSESRQRRYRVKIQECCATCGSALTASRKYPWNKDYICWHHMADYGCDTYNSNFHCSQWEIRPGLEAALGVEEE